MSNSGALRGVATRTFGKVSDAGKVLTGEGFEPAARLLVAPPGATALFNPGAANGDVGDYAINIYDGGNNNSHSAKLVGPKAASGWNTGNAHLNAAGDTVVLPFRSRSMQSADLLPGWFMTFDSVWCTGTVPSDMKRTGTFGGTSFQANASGTNAFLSRCRTSTGAALPFFSCYIKFTALPEATRFLHVGQFTDSGGSPYGYGARIDSSGNVTIRSIDSFLSGDVQLDSGLTIGASDGLLIERFGQRMSVYKVASGSRVLIDADDATATNRPLNALVGQGAVDAYAASFAASSFGMYTDSTSVRVSQLEFAG